MSSKKLSAEESNARVRVIVRIRPLGKKELEANVPEVVRWPQPETGVDPRTTLSILDPACLGAGIRRELLKSWSRDFMFDQCLWSNVSSDHELYGKQEELYRQVGEPVIEWITTGYNCCVFAFGQTGSGKTHSMMGNLKGSPLDYGLTPRICFSLFTFLAQQTRNAAVGTNTDSFVTMSHMEIYNENCRDLLTAPKQVAAPLKLREHPQKGIFVAGLTHVRVTCFEEVMSLVEIGNKNRTVAATNANLHSSRSHAIVTLTVVQRARQSAGAGMGVLPTANLHKLEGRVHLVDLAGSERVALSGAKGGRLKEACSINKSLSVLGDVILSLSSEKRGHVPYRNSALTMVLKDSLGGNSHAIMVATVSPSAYDYEETLSTLKYADRAKRVRMRVDANVTSGLHATNSDSATLVPLLQAEVRKLKEMLAAQQRASEEMHERLLTQSSANTPPSTNSSAAGVFADTEIDANDRRRLQKQEQPQSLPAHTDVASMRVRMSELEQQLAEREELIVSLEMARTHGSVDEPRVSSHTATPSTREGDAVLLTVAPKQGKGPVRAVLASEARDEQSPRLINLNQDPLFSEVLVYYLPSGEVVLAGSAESALVPLAGPDVLPLHCELFLNSATGDVFLTPLGDAEVHVNGILVHGKRMLSHRDRLAFGRFHLFRFDACPTNGKSSSPGMGWKKAQQELLYAIGNVRSFSPGLTAALVGLNAALENAPPIQAIAMSRQREETPTSTPTTVSSEIQLTPNIAISKSGVGALKVRTGLPSQAMEQSFDNTPGTLNASLEAALEYLDKIDWDDAHAQQLVSAAAPVSAATIAALDPQQSTANASPRMPSTTAGTPLDDFDTYYEYVISPQREQNHADADLASAPVQTNDRGSKKAIAPANSVLASATGEGPAGGVNPSSVATAAPRPRNTFEAEANALKEDLQNMQAALAARMARYAAITSNSTVSLM